MSASKRLFVLRHAKSSWDDPGLDDHERPLAPRGRRAVDAIASYVDKQGIEPEVVLCSTSRRTRETLAGIEVGGEHLIEPSLYGATCDELLDRLRQLPGEVSSAMVVGHNPAAQMLVLRLSNHAGAGRDDAERDAVKRKFPTGALATLSLDCDWSELAPGCARLDGFISPKEFSAAREAARVAPRRLASTEAR